MRKKERWIYVLIGMALMLMILATLGSASSQFQYGRYQISAWGARFGENAGGCGAFIVDTMTGETKTAYTVIYGNPDSGVKRVYNLKKPFQQIR